MAMALSRSVTDCKAYWRYLKPTLTSVLGLQKTDKEDNVVLHLGWARHAWAPVKQA